MSLQQQFPFDVEGVASQTKVVFVTPVCYCSGLPPVPQLHTINQANPKTPYDELVDSFVQSNIKALEKTSKKRPIENNTTPSKRPRLDKSPKKNQCHTNSTFVEEPNLKTATDSVKSKNLKSWASDYLQTIGQTPKAIKLNLKTKELKNCITQSKCERNEMKTNENILQTTTNKKTMHKESYNTIDQFAPVRPKLKFVIPKLNKSKEDDTVKALGVDAKKRPNINTFDCKESKTNDKVIHNRDHSSLEPTLEKHQKINIHSNDPGSKTLIEGKNNKRTLQLVHSNKQVNLKENKNENKKEIFTKNPKDTVKIKNNIKIKKDKTKYRLDEKTMKKILQLKEVNSILRSRKSKTSSVCTETSKRKHSDTKQTSKTAVEQKHRTKESTAPIKSAISLKDEKISKKIKLPFTPSADKSCNIKNYKDKSYKENEHKKTKPTKSSYPSTSILDTFTDKLSSNIVCYTPKTNYNMKLSSDMYLHKENKNRKMKSIVTPCRSLLDTLTEDEDSDQFNCIDLRLKLNEMEKNKKLTSNKYGYDRRNKKLRENLIINVNNENINSTQNKIIEKTKKTKENSFKEVKVVINIIREQKQYQPMQDESLEDSDINDELGFLDDFNIDEVVNYLKECENKMETFETDESNDAPDMKNSDDNIEDKLAMLFEESTVKKPGHLSITSLEDGVAICQNNIKIEDNFTEKEIIIDEPINLDYSGDKLSHKSNNLFAENTKYTDKPDKPSTEFNKNLSVLSADIKVDMTHIDNDDKEAKNIIKLEDPENRQTTLLDNCFLKPSAVESSMQEEPNLTIFKETDSKETNLKQIEETQNPIKNVLPTSRGAEADIPKYNEQTGLKNVVSNTKEISSNSLPQEDKNEKHEMSSEIKEESNNFSEKQLPLGGESDGIIVKQSVIQRKVTVEPMPCNSYVQDENMKGFTSTCDAILAKVLEIKMSVYLKDKFTMLSVIHRGKFSTIFCCKNSTDERFVAKVLNNDCDRQINIHSAMIKEYQKEIPKDNLNCVYLIESFEIQKKMAFLLEYYPYNLSQYLKKEKKSFHVDDLQNLARQLIGAVTTLRNNKIVHSDIKPSHILINPSGKQLKLCGFDAAYYVLPAILRPNIGSINYRAPEIILGYSASFSIDVWSTAVVMYEMATGHQLFPGTFNNNMLYQQMCTLGNMPLELLNGSYVMLHFSGTSFIRKLGYKGQQTILIQQFKKSDRIATSIFEAYAKDWSQSVPKTKRDVDATKLRSLHRLLERMLALHPKFRLAIEFVYASPFIYEKHAD